MTNKPERGIEELREKLQLNDIEIANITNLLHQELQKARQSWLREEIVKLKEEILDAELHYGMRGFEQTQYYCYALRGVLDRYQSELDHLPDRPLNNERE